MDCETAQQMIAEGLRPSASTPAQAQLGFHLSGCAACRAAYAAAQAAPPAPAAPAQSIPTAPVTTIALAPPAAARHWPARLRRWLRLGGLAVLLLLVLGAGYLGVVAVRTYQHVEAMLIAPVSEVVLPTLTPPRSPTATAPASATPLPTATPTATTPPAPTVTTPPAATATPVRVAVREVFSDGAPSVRIITITPVPTQPGKASGVVAFFNPFRATDTPTPTPTPLPTNTPLPVPTRAPRPSLPQLPPNLAVVPGEGITVLLVGVDQRPGEYTAPRADALMLVRINPQWQRVALLSLPRDLWVEIPGGYGYDRINTAYTYGEATGIWGGGLALTRATVSNLLGVPIDYVAMVDFYGFISLVDTVGGIVVNVPNAIYDAAYPTMDYGYMTVSFAPGVQWMDGNTALIYSRTRNADSDFSRIRRQQDVLMALGVRLQERGDLLNLLTLDQTSAALLPYVRTDMPRDTLVNLFWSLRGISRGQIEQYSVTFEDVQMGRGDDMYALVPNYAALRAVTARWLGYR